MEDVKVLACFTWLLELSRWMEGDSTGVDFGS